MIKKLYLLVALHLFASIARGSANSYEDNKALFENKNILITGGTGFLGKMLAQEILKHNPKTIKIISRDEVKLFHLQKFFDHPSIEYVMGDIRDYECLLFHTRDMDLIIHAAALKRIDDLEKNVEESIKTNILGAINIFHAAIINKVKKVVYISTDKACMPVNIYGACKFASEKLFSNYDNKNIDTIFTTVRFGNILESTGSIIPLFIDKIKNGETLTLTDPRMTRFIINKQEAVEYIFTAIKYAIGGEVFIKRIPSIKISDLIEILKQKYNADNEVKITGLRPGEKIDEMLINEAEFARTYEYKNLLIITPSLNQWIINLKNKNIIPEYIKNGKLCDTSKNCSYHSGNSLISQEDAYMLFKRINLI